MNKCTKILIYYFITIYSYIITNFLLIKEYFFPKRNVFFAIDYVSEDSKNITNEYLTNKAKIEDKKWTMYWTFDNKQYIQVIDRQSVDSFPPYSFYHMRNHFQMHKIISGLLKDNANNFTDVTHIVKKIAGPNQNFYKDTVDFEVHTKDFFGLVDQKLVIITLLSTVEFDLSKDNVLEL